MPSSVLVSGDYSVAGPRVGTLHNLQSAGQSANLQDMRGRVKERAVKSAVHRQACTEDGS